MVVNVPYRSGITFFRFLLGCPKFFHFFQKTTQMLTFKPDACATNIPIMRNIDYC